MSLRYEGEVYSGITSDVLLVIEQVAQRMAEASLRETEICLPFSSGRTVTIKMKR